MRLVNWRTLIASAASIALAACGDDVTVVQPPPTLTPSSGYPTKLDLQLVSGTASLVTALNGTLIPTYAARPIDTANKRAPCVSSSGATYTQECTCHRSK